MGQLYEVGLTYLSLFVQVSRRIHILTEVHLSFTKLTVDAAWPQIPEGGPLWPRLCSVISFVKFHSAVEELNNFLLV